MLQQAKEPSLKLITRLRQVPLFDSLHQHQNIQLRSFCNRQYHRAQTNTVHTRLAQLRQKVMTKCHQLVNKANNATSMQTHGNSVRFYFHTRAS